MPVDNVMLVSFFAVGLCGAKMSAGAYEAVI